MHAFAAVIPYLHHTYVGKLMTKYGLVGLANAFDSAFDTTVHAAQHLVGLVR